MCHCNMDGFSEVTDATAHGTGQIATTLWLFQLCIIGHT